MVLGVDRVTIVNITCSQSHSFVYTQLLCMHAYLDGLKGGIKNETIIYYEERPEYVNRETDGSGNALCRSILDK